MAWEFERHFGVMHFFLKDGLLPIKRSGCGAWVKGVCDPEAYGDDDAKGVCKVCVDKYDLEGRERE